jgi:hypothetical protein
MDRSDIFEYIHRVPTTVHIPAALLERVDARAKALGVSRNRFIVRALEAELAPRSQWPPELVEMLRGPTDPDVAAAVDEMLDIISSSRRSKHQPPKL